MLRRSFLEVVFCCGCHRSRHHARLPPRRRGRARAPRARDHKVEQSISPVLQALNDWNETRWREHGEVLHEDGGRLIWNAERMEFSITCPRCFSRPGRPRSE